MRRLAVLAGVVLLVALYGSSTSAQEPPPDQGDTRLLVIACDYMRNIAELESLTVRWCRENGEADVNGNRASVPLKVKVAGLGGPLEFELRMVKSLWTVQVAL